MPVQIQRRLPECGRIRIGKKGPSGAPQKLDTFRLTSQNRAELEYAAKIYGGKVMNWPDRPGEFELITEKAELPVLISPEPPSLWWEEWSAGGCKKRCDGNECTVPDGRGGMKIVQCTCNPEDRTCKLKTRVSFLLPDLPGLAIWRLDTGSYYAAQELPGQLEILQRFKSQGMFPEAVLALVKRSVKRQNKEGKPETRNFAVVTLRINTGQPLRELLAGGPASPQIGAGGMKAIESYADPETGEIIEHEPPSSAGFTEPTSAGHGEVNQTKGE